MGWREKKVAWSIGRLFVFSASTERQYILLSFLSQVCFRANVPDPTAAATRSSCDYCFQAKNITEVPRAE